jgi:hypothetical protein
VEFSINVHGKTIFTYEITLCESDYCIHDSYKSEFSKFNLNPHANGFISIIKNHPIKANAFGQASLTALTAGVQLYAFEKCL